MPLQGPLPFTTIFVDYFRLPSDLRSAQEFWDVSAEKWPRFRLDGGSLRHRFGGRALSSHGAEPSKFNLSGFREKERNAFLQTVTNSTEQPQILLDKIPGHSHQGLHLQIGDQGISSTESKRFHFYVNRPWVFFLTHFHADHIRGLCKNWHAGSIFCSEITRKFLLRRFPSLGNVTVPLQLNQVYTFVFHAARVEECEGQQKRRRLEGNCSEESAGSRHQLCRENNGQERRHGKKGASPRNKGSIGEKRAMTKDENSSTEQLETERDEDIDGVAVRVMLLDAHHCPGSVMLVLQSAAFGVYVHTGDFGCSTSDVLGRMTLSVKNAIQRLRGPESNGRKSFPFEGIENSVTDFESKEAGGSLPSFSCGRGTTSETPNENLFPSCSSSLSPGKVSRPSTAVFRNRTSEADERASPHTFCEHGDACRVDHLFLDNTYLHPAYEFSSSPDSFSKLLEWIRTLRSLLLLRRGPQSLLCKRGGQRDTAALSPSLWVVVGVDSVGKEELLVSLASHMSTRVEVPVTRYSTVQIALGSEVASRYFKAGLPLDLERALHCKSSRAGTAANPGSPDDALRGFCLSATCCPCTPCASVSAGQCVFCEPGRDRGCDVAGKEERRDAEQQPGTCLRRQLGKIQEKEEEPRQKGGQDSSAQEDQGDQELEEGELQERSHDGRNGEGERESQRGWGEAEIEEKAGERQEKSYPPPYGSRSEGKRHQSELRIFAVSRHALSRCVNCLYRQGQTAFSDYFYENGARKSREIPGEKEGAGTQAALLSRLVVGVFCSGWLARSDSTQTESGASCSSSSFPSSLSAAFVSADQRSQLPVDRSGRRSQPLYFSLLYSSHADFFHLCRFTLSLSPRAVSLLSPVPCPYYRSSRAEREVPSSSAQRVEKPDPHVCSVLPSDGTPSSTCSLGLLRDVVFPSSFAWFSSSPKDDFLRSQTVASAFEYLQPGSSGFSRGAAPAVLASSFSDPRAALLSPARRSSTNRAPFSVPRMLFEYDGDEGLALFMEACGLSTVVLAAGRTCLFSRRSRLLLTAGKTSPENEAHRGDPQSRHRKDSQSRRSGTQHGCPRHGHLLLAALRGACPVTELRRKAPEVSLEVTAPNDSERISEDANLFGCRATIQVSFSEKAESQQIVEAASCQDCSPPLGYGSEQWQRFAGKTAPTLQLKNPFGDASSTVEKSQEKEGTKCGLQIPPEETPTTSGSGSTNGDVELLSERNFFVQSEEAKPAAGSSGPLLPILLDAPRIVVRREGGTSGGLRRRR
ncbi:kinase domain protein [Cystoisospora suis]|uniref:Kinase domain protein n=1 Tax=Cystoisospora suis TaxID=483139 RepID=A0A2C6KHK4_9APIC|nr:kinase domain protein [Cystoisospora suis]